MGRVGAEALAGATGHKRGRSHRNRAPIAADEGIPDLHRPWRPRTESVASRPATTCGLVFSCRTAVTMVEQSRHSCPRRSAHVACQPPPSPSRRARPRPGHRPGRQLRAKLGVCRYRPRRRGRYRLRAVHPAQRPARGGSHRPQGADRGGEHLVPRRQQGRTGRPHRVRAPVRAPDVQRLGKPSGRILRPVRAGRRHRHERHHQLRPHQLLRERAYHRAGHGAVDGIRPHGPPARRDRPEDPRRAARGGPEREAPGREPALRPGRRRAVPGAVPEGPPVPPQHDRLDERPQRGLAGGREELVPRLVRPEQRGAGAGRRHRRRHRQGEGRALLRRHPGRTKPGARPGRTGEARGQPRDDDRQGPAGAHLPRLERGRLRRCRCRPPAGAVAGPRRQPQLAPGPPPGPRGEAGRQGQRLRATVRAGVHLLHHRRREAGRGPGQGRGDHRRGAAQAAGRRPDGRRTAAGAGHARGRVRARHRAHRRLRRQGRRAGRMRGVHQGPRLLPRQPGSGPRHHRRQLQGHRPALAGRRFAHPGGGAGRPGRASIRQPRRVAGRDAGRRRPHRACPW